jgi:hypothetical protein
MPQRSVPPQSITATPISASGGSPSLKPSTASQPVSSRSLSTIAGRVPAVM